MSFPGEGIASSLIAGGLNYVGQREANRMNRELAREQMRFQRESTDKQMAFQERMSNTAYQRAVADLEAAGLNPMLAYMQGGAGSPAGASSGGSTSHMKSETAAAVAAATAARQAFRPDFSDVGSALASMAQARAAMLNAEQNATLTPYRINQILGDTNYRNIGVGQSGYWNASTGGPSALS